MDLDVTLEELYTGNFIEVSTKLKIKHDHIYVYNITVFKNKHECYCFKILQINQRTF